MAYLLEELQKEDLVDAYGIVGEDQFWLEQQLDAGTVEVVNFGWGDVDFMYLKLTSLVVGGP